jgi:DNA polymerase-3 subunit beta
MPSRKKRRKKSKSIHGDAIDVGFNVGYLLDVLNNVHAEEIQWSFNDANSSALITVPGNDRFKYVVMPMRI